MMKNNRYESGQIIVLLAVAIVGILAIAALAVDFGMVSADRRYAQSVADSAALAGGQKAAMKLENEHVLLTYMDETDAAVQQAIAQAKAAAKANAATNDVDLDYDISDSHGIEVAYGYQPYDSYEDKWIDVKVVLTSTTRMSFAQVFFTDGIQNTVTAIVRVRPRANLGYGYAIAALDTECEASFKNLEFDGGGSGGSITVTGGGIISNSCILASGHTSITVDPPEEGINYVGGINLNGEPVLVPEATDVDTPLPTQTIPIPDCFSQPTRTVPSSGNLLPGLYDGISLHRDAVLEPGLYCLTDDFSIGNDNLYGVGVTFVMLSGGFETGQGTIVLAAPLSDAPPAITGMLVYLVPGNTSEIKLVGNSDSHFTGTLYAPDGTIQIGGTSGVNPTYNTQLVADDIKVNGSAILNIVFDGYQNAQTPSVLEVNR